MNVIDYVFQQLVNAVSLGSLYALIAVGLSLVFGILNLINFAHGDMMMVGAFAALLLESAGVPFPLALLGGVVFGGAAGFVMERAAFRPVRGAPDVTMLLTSLGVTYILENLGILLFSASPRNFPLPVWLGHVYKLAGGRITFTNINLLTLVFSVLAFLFLYWFVTRTGVGLGMRATAEDLVAARLVGVRVNLVVVVAFVLASAFAGLAGLLWAAQVGVAYPLMGFTPMLKSFVAAIIGGFGTIEGALLGGYVLGALEIAIVAFLPPSVSPYRDALVFALLIVLLLFRPGGIINVRREVKL
ncbi:MAG TPA: branched-chain amino acid ABC transporter permease [Longimicrobiales bacterium]|nr:branched-chain amino acid ABC transporter permease [Trueperaceae bacterium]HKJ92553.1 branched-chain amino acid ABC transporter permease [Longimicrobiales bacterium]